MATTLSKKVTPGVVGSRRRAGPVVAARRVIIAPLIVEALGGVGGLWRSSATTTPRTCRRTPRRRTSSRRRPRSSWSRCRRSGVHAQGRRHHDPGGSAILTIQAIHLRAAEPGARRAADRADRDRPVRRAPTSCCCSSGPTPTPSGRTSTTSDRWAGRTSRATTCRRWPAAAQTDPIEVSGDCPAAARVTGAVVLLIRRGLLQPDPALPRAVGRRHRLGMADGPPT
jgi:hypothetical protein